MKQTLTLIISVFILQTLSAQNISVESFTKLENDMDARVHNSKRDQNGELSAIIKVVTSEIGFAWDGGSLGIVDAVRKTGEYWVYVPRGAQRITISHDRLGVLRNYAYPIPIEAAMVYEMRLITSRIETTVIPPELESQWLLITSEPNTALIYLNDAFESTGLLQKRLLPGTYTYRIENNLYHTEAGRITVTSDKRAELSVKLKPNFGFIEVKSTPETGARVQLNGRDAGFLTNGKSEQLQSGDYTITVIKEQFQPVSRQVTVTDNQTTTLTLDMSPNFATVEVSLPADANLFINNERRSTGNWSGRLNAGVYTFEARKDKYRPAKQDLQLQVGDSHTIELQPQPITGSLDVVTIPPMASIKLNGKDYGTTPNTIRNLLIGEYTVLLEKQGHASVNKSITVTEGVSTLVNETLPSGMSITITSNPTGAELFINNQKVGTTHYTSQLSFGSHRIKLISQGKIIEETIQITQVGKNTFTFNFATELKIGDRAHGGIVFYLDGKGGGLVCAESDQSQGTQWGCLGTTSGAADANIGKGAANTDAIVVHCSQARIAARICKDLVLNGYTDWFLPSKDELNLMYQNLKKSGKGGFTDFLYWSSSEYISTSAFVQHFGSGTQNFGSKGLNARVRAIRTF